jgi:hypothetical protein
VLFEMGSLCIAQAGLKLLSPSDLLRQPPMYWDYTHYYHI